MAAVRMGFISKPRWCFSNKPLTLSMAVDKVTANTDPPCVLISVKFIAQQEFYAVPTYDVNNVACE